MKYRTLRLKLGLWSAAASGLVVLVFSVGTSISFYFEMREALDLVLADASARIIERYGKEPQSLSGLLQASTERVFLDEIIEVSVFRLRNEDKRMDLRGPQWSDTVFGTTDESEDARTAVIGEVEFPVGVVEWERWTASIGDVKYRVGMVEYKGWTVTAGARFDLLHEEIFDLAVEYLIVLPWAMLAAGLGGWWIGRIALRPIEVIIVNAEAVTASGSGEEIPETSSHEELRRLTRVINDMVERLKNAYAQASRFSADASHQLKTPLTIIQGELDAALKTQAATEDVNPHIERSIEQVHRLKQITDSLLILSRSDAGKLELDKQLLDLVATVREMLEDCDVPGESRGLEFDANLAENLTVEADESLIRQAIFNVLENAIRFSAPGGKIWCTLEAAEGAAKLIVANTGVEIKGEARDKIFERFFSEYSGEMGNHGGLGLGLSLSREILKAHGGSIVLNHSEARRTEFVMRIPLHGVERH